MQDGQLAVFGRCGQVIAEKDSEEAFLILATYKYAVMTWPLKALTVHDFGPRFRGWQIEAGRNAQACWKFLHSPQSWVAWSIDKRWHANIGLYLRACQADEENLPQNTLRYFAQLTFNELVAMAKYFGDIERPDRLARRELLSQLCARFGLEFAEEILDTEANVKETGHDFNASKEFLSCILENLDPDEKQNFDNLGKSIDKAKKAETQKRWRNLLAEKNAEQHVPWLLAAVDAVRCLFLKPTVC